MVARGSADQNATSIPGPAMMVGRGQSTMSARLGRTVTIAALGEGSRAQLGPSIFPQGHFYQGHDVCPRACLKNKIVEVVIFVPQVVTTILQTKVSRVQEFVLRVSTET